MNSGSLSTLEAGNSLLVQARRVSGGKIQLELAEVVNASEPNLVSMFNKSDERFSQSGARRGWMSVEPSDASENLGIDLSDVNPGWTTNDRGHEILPLNILNPKIGKDVLRLQIVETTEPTAYQASNLETTAKRKGKDGDFITHNGDYIFSSGRFVSGQVGEVIDHILLTADVVAPATISKQSAPFGTIES